MSWSLGKVERQSFVTIGVKVCVEVIMTQWLPNTIRDCFILLKAFQLERTLLPSVLALLSRSEKLGSQDGSAGKYACHTSLVT